VKPPQVFIRKVKYLKQELADTPSAMLLTYVSEITLLIIARIPCALASALSAPDRSPLFVDGGSPIHDPITLARGGLRMIRHAAR
jgi:hypothetical protein